MIPDVKDINIPEKLILEIANSESYFCRKVKKRDPLEEAKKMSYSYKYAVNYLERLIGKGKLKELKILEIGSGNGFSLCYALKSGLQIVGIEPGDRHGFKDRYLRAISLLRINGIENPEDFLFDASVENLPFNDSSFDVVFSVAVLEHVQNLDLAMKESLRVLKPRGVLWANTINYNSIYESHYNIPWIPYMDKNRAKFYVKKFFNRNPYFIDELNFTSPSMFKKYLNSSQTYGRIYLYGKGVFGFIFNLYNYCMDIRLLPDPENSTGIKKAAILLIRNKMFNLCLRSPLYLLVKIMEAFGFALIFDMVLYNRDKYENRILQA